MVMKTQKKPSLIDAINARSQISPYKSSLNSLDPAAQAEVRAAALHVAKNSLSMRGAYAVVRETHPSLKETTWEELVRKAKRGEL